MRNVLKSFPKHAAITLLYLLFGLSLGCYYTATYFGGTGLPVPPCEAISGILFYYFSVVNASTEIQAVHWMITFVLAGYIWIAALWCTFRVSARTGHAAPTYDEAPGAPNRFAALGLSVASATIPLSLPLPFMIRWMGTAGDGFSWSRFIAVCLRHAWVNPPMWLNYVYLGLGSVALVVQVVLVRRLWRVSWKRFLVTFAIAFCMALVVSIASGAILSLPLRAALER